MKIFLYCLGPTLAGLIGLAAFTNIYSALAFFLICFGALYKVETRNQIRKYDDRVTVDRRLKAEQEVIRQFEKQH